MNGYLPLLVIHITSVILWLGTTTALTLLGTYATGRQDRELAERMPALARWFGPRIIGPSSLGTLASGILLAIITYRDLSVLWVAFALGAFAFATLVSVGVRLPATRWRARALAGSQIAQVARADLLLLRGAELELTILYLAVADMVLKPTSATTAWIVVGTAVLAFAILRVLFVFTWNAPRAQGTVP